MTALRRRRTGARIDPTCTFSQFFKLPAGSLMAMAAKRGPVLTYTGNGGTSMIWDENAILVSTINNQPRFDHDPVTGAALGLLIEEARENLCLQSEDFSTTWTVTGPPVITTNSAVAPDGNTTADTLEDDDNGAWESVSQSFTVVNDSTSWVFSLYIKKDADTTRFPEIQIRFAGGTAIQTALQLNTSTGAINHRMGSGAVSVTDVGDYWRLVLSGSNNSTGNTTLEIWVFPAVTTVFGNIEASATGSIIAWGAQLENAAFPTSYIKTTTAAVTRSVDVATVTLSDVPEFDETQGTFFVEGSVLALDPFQYLIFMNNGDSDTLDAHIILIDMDNHMRYLVTNTVDVADFHGGGSPSINMAFKVAVTYALNDFSGYFNGTAMGTDTSGAPPTSQTIIQLGNRYDAARALNGHIAQIKYWDVRKPNGFLQFITA